MARLAQRALVVDDEPDFLALLGQTLNGLGFDVIPAHDLEQALHALGTSCPDVVLSDLRLGTHDGLALCSRAKEVAPDVPVIVMTAFGDLDRAVDAMRAGAADFLTKPFAIDALESALERAMQRRDVQSHMDALHVTGPRSVARPDGMVGDSREMSIVYDLVERVADLELSVLITGETGVGKELVAHAIHDARSAADAPFVALNCAAMPLSLLETELFGHARGAFTDARGRRDGLFVEAGTGTLFLDEIGEMPLEVQPKLLRALQERKVRPLGADHEVDVRCRVLAATNRDLEADVAAGHFREDLYYRVNVVQIPVPPLRQRVEDILPLAQHFLEREAARSNDRVMGISDAAAELLLSYRWPGNVRELANCIARAVALTRHDRLVPEDLPARIRSVTGPVAVEHARGDAAEHLPTLAEVEERHLRRVMRATGGNKAAAARILGIDRRTLYRKLERLDATEVRG